jgi:hypothetical protein
VLSIFPLIVIFFAVSLGSLRRHAAVHGNLLACDKRRGRK